MKGRTLSFVTVLVILLLVLASCAPATEPTSAPGQGGATEEPTAAAPAETAVPEATTAEGTPATEPTVEETPADIPATGGETTGTVTLWHSWKESEIPALNDVIAAFQEQNPGIAFQLLYVPHDDLRGKFETAAATGGGPTVLIGAADWGTSFYDALLVADLTDLASEEFLGTINAAAVDAVRYQDALIGLPHTLKGVVLFRNKSIIPDAPATFDDFIAAAEAATEGDVVGASLERGFFFSAGHLLGIGGQIMNEDGSPAFNTDKGVEWVNLLQRFSDAGPTEYNTDNDVNLFKAGRAGMIIDGTWNTTALAEAIGAENLVIDPWPTTADGRLAGFVQTENLYLSENATGEDRDAGWRFMEFFMSPEAQQVLLKVGHIPAITGIDITDPFMEQTVAAFEEGVPFPVNPEMSFYWESMDTALQSVFDEGADPATALQTAQESIQAKIDEAAANQ
ncbi:MAG: sugar ABC transporter substrate-binding protein [Anaerolineae bacterium]